MSDSADVVTAAAEQTFSDRLLTVPGEIRHIDKISALGFQEICSAFDRVVTEVHLLMNCDVVLKARSGLSALAGFVRGSDRDLFCLYSNGSIYPCKRAFSHAKGLDPYMSVFG